MQTLLIVLGWVFGTLLSILLVMYVVFVIDAALSRRTMRTEVSAPLLQPLSVGGGTRVLVVYLPGILARTADKPRVFYDALAAGLRGTTADLLALDYTGEAFDPSATIAQVCDRIEGVLGRPDNGRYHKLLLVGESLGGRMVNLVMDELQARGCADKLVQPVIIDAPMDYRDFAAGGDTLAMVLRYVPMGRLVNHLGLADRLFTQPAGLPQAKNIANAGDMLNMSYGNALTYEQYVAWVQLCARRGLSGHRFSVYRDQLVAMTRLPWGSDVFAKRPPIYLVCTSEDTPAAWHEYTQPVSVMLDGTCPLERPVNATIKQPEAVKRWKTVVPAMVNWDVRVVRSTHCGYMERPLAWRNALADAVSDAIG